MHTYIREEAEYDLASRQMGSKGLMTSMFVGAKGPCSSSCTSKRGVYHAADVCSCSEILEVGADLSLGKISSGELVFHAEA